MRAELLAGAGGFSEKATTAEAGELVEVLADVLITELDESLTGALTGPATGVLAEEFAGALKLGAVTGADSSATFANATSTSPTGATGVVDTALVSFVI